MIEIEIDGKKIKAEQGEMLISVTDREGISVPRFCYHKKLSVAASCRMCLVDVEGAPKPQTACSTPAADGMIIHTNNEKAKASQKAVMEFLLINHPLDCPICDQGGECELQDVAMSYGSDVSSFNEGKRIINDKGIGPLIHTDMTRCIHCTRCVRFGQEVAGIMEMGGTGRGDALKIEPFLEEGITSELSGNMIDVCPVGALTSKPFRYELRSWQMNAVKNIARHDLLGSNIYSQTYKGKVKRVVAGDNDDLNETWISDRDRFSYEGINSSNRLLSPRIKVEGQWQDASWDVALDFAIRGLRGNVLKNNQPNQLGALASSNATLEEYFLLQKIMRELGSENIDFRLSEVNTKDQLNLNSNIKIAEIEKADLVLIVGSNPRLEQPMINHRIRKASNNKAKVFSINSKSFDFNYQINQNLISPSKVPNMLASILREAKVKSSNLSSLTDAQNTDETLEIANAIKNSTNPLIVIGEHYKNTKNWSSIVSLINLLAKDTDAGILNISGTGNYFGAILAEFLPGEGGLDANTMIDKQLPAYMLFDVYPSYDSHNAENFVNSLKSEKSFVISFNSFQDDLVEQYSNVILPIASFYETSGSHVNCENKIQSFAAAVKSPGESKPGWKVLKVFADLLELQGFHYTDSTQVTNEVGFQSAKSNKADKEIKIPKSNSLEVIWQSSPYIIDPVLRNAEALQNTNIGKMNIAFMNSKTAKKLKLNDKSVYLNIPVSITDDVSDSCVIIQTNQSTMKRSA